MTLLSSIIDNIYIVKLTRQHIQSLIELRIGLRDNLRTCY